MIADKDRRYWFGASDSAKILNPNHDTKTWQKWWRVKCGIDEDEFFGNVYTDAGTRFEHPILDCFDSDINKDRQLIIPELRLRVNYDGDKDGNIFEVKTHRADKSFTITTYIASQVQTEMYVWQEVVGELKGLYILSYGLTEADYLNEAPTAEDVDYNRIKIHRVKYKPKQIRRFLKCLEPLAEEIKKNIPEEEENGEETMEHIR